MTVGELLKLIKDLPPTRKLIVRKYIDSGNKSNQMVEIHLTDEVFVVLEVEGS